VLQNRAPERCGLDVEASVVEIHDGLHATLAPKEPGMYHVSQSNVRRLEPHWSRFED